MTLDIELPVATIAFCLRRWRARRRWRMPRKPRKVWARELANAVRVRPRVPPCHGLALPCTLVMGYRHTRGESRRRSWPTAPDVRLAGSGSCRCRSRRPVHGIRLRSVF